MAQVSITLADDGTDDGVLFRVEFDPPLKEDSLLTAAQSEAGWLIEVMQRRASGQSLAEMAVEMDDELHEVEIALGPGEKEEEGKPN